MVITVSSPFICVFSCRNPVCILYSSVASGVCPMVITVSSPFICVFSCRNPVCILYSSVASDSRSFVYALCSVAILQASVMYQVNVGQTTGKPVLCSSMNLSSLASLNATEGPQDLMRKNNEHNHDFKKDNRIFFRYLTSFCVWYFSNILETFWWI